MAFELDRLDQSGIATLTPFDEGYPERLHASLGSKRPAILHAAGALELLDQPGVGVVGSRNVSREGAEVAKALGRQAASLGLPLTSGAARGVDQLAMSAAFQAGGTVVGVPAHSLSPDAEVSRGAAGCSRRADGDVLTVRSGLRVLGRQGDGPEQAHIRVVGRDGGGRC